MNPLEYFMQGSWCMCLIALSGVLLYTLLVERLLSARSMRHEQHALNNEMDLMLLHIRRTEHLVLIRALIAAIPLMGLLGTVTGMMESFIGMRGDQNTIGLGISQALITTQYALVLATPALIVERYLSYGVTRDSQVDRHVLSGIR